MSFITNLPTLLLLLLTITTSQTILHCVSQSFQSSCKQILYSCFDSPGCSYQLTMNTQHLTLTDNLEPRHFHSVFFSDPKAIELYTCIQTHCKSKGLDLPNMDREFVRNMALPFCMFEVYEKCGGKDMEAIYKELTTKQIGSKEAQCYKSECL